MKTAKNNADAKQKGIMTNLRRLLGYLTRYKVRFSLMIAIMIGYSIMLAIIPTISGIIMNILSGSSGSLTEFQNIIFVLVVAVIMFWFLETYLRGYLGCCSEGTLQFKNRNFQ